jgi:hypothetical protein
MRPDPGRVPLGNAVEWHREGLPPMPTWNNGDYEAVDDDRMKAVEDVVMRMADELASQRNYLMVNTVMITILTATFIMVAGRLIAKGLGG